MSLSRFEAQRRALEEELKDVFSGREGFLYDLLRYHFGWADQRGQPEDLPLALHLQSLLALVCCEALSGDFQAALPAAAGIELVYNFTLVHSDVQSGRVDQQDRPSIWWVWGPAQAINAGDGLHALGRTTIMRLAQRGVAADQVLRAVGLLDGACLTLCEGQYMDLDFQDQLLVTTGAYYDMIGRKTGALAGCSAELGALAAGGDESVCLQVRAAGTRLGMAWQIGQDINDFWGRRGDGMTASNVLNKKKSLPLILAMETAELAVKRELGNIYAKRVLQPDDVSRVIEILDQAQARQSSEAKARELVDEALAALADAGLAEDRMGDLKFLSMWVLEGNG
ncbi:MAG: polyprenyl synthetase family protein [Chloroflexi bacterium]|nr:polyprenyl synthetase family protein [Chloroflexota bacterium]MCH8224652.1 polyprenyl synthetase family protein [Chloroflexota bacterium]